MFNWFKNLFKRKKEATPKKRVAKAKNEPKFVDAEQLIIQEASCDEHQELCSCAKEMQQVKMNMIESKNLSEANNSDIEKLMKEMGM